LLTVQAAAYQKPTISKLIALEDNYFPAASKAEVVTTQESLEEAAFLDAIFATPVMKRAEEFLVDKGYIVTRKYGRDGKVTVNRNAFREAFQEIWFGLYTREKNVLGSSGFEHVFVGETKNGEVSGFHNWVQFSKQETANSVNYNGQFRVLRLGPVSSWLIFNSFILS
jgi:poly(U)-specific endoribonuclease